MFCGDCGFNTGEKPFCQGCGKRLRPVKSSGTATPAPPQTPSTRLPTKQKSGGGIRYIIGLILVVAALYFGASSCSEGSSSPVDPSPSTTTDFQDKEVRTPAQDFSITQGCDEIRSDYMDAPAGSQEEKWALEAADEACFAP